MTAHSKNKSVYTGIVILVIGLIWLLRRMGVYLPYWIFSWETLLIAIGLIIGIDNKFRNPASYILIAIGSVFLINDIFQIEFNVFQYFWPLLVMGVGLTIIFQSRFRKSRAVIGSDSNHGEQLDITSVFNGVKRNVNSKSFNGGDVVTIFGGAEINLMQADFEGQIQIDATVVFGGLKLIVPKNWEVRTEATSIFGGIDDKRQSAVNVLPDEKVLIISGTVLFGGLDIVNY
jgi:predicted membrane protein